MRFDLVVFDLDGTLVDSIVDIAGALNHVLSRHGWQATPVATVTSLVGDGVNMLVRRALERQLQGGAALPDDGAIANLAQEIWDHYVAHPCVDSRPFADIPQVLATLRQAGSRLAVLTNKPGNVARLLLSALDMTDDFADILGDMDGHGRKPEPAGALELIRRAGTHAERTLIVGDGLPDMRVARAVGARCAAALWGYGAADKLLAEAPDFALRAPLGLLKLA